MPVSKLYSIRDVQYDHAEKCDRKQDRHAWGKEEGTPGDDEHLRILVVNLELISAVEVLVSKQGLLAGFLRWELATAASLVDSTQNHTQQPQNSEFDRGKYGVDDHN